MPRSPCSYDCVPIRKVSRWRRGVKSLARAPCKSEEREWFARCLTAVEDIPTEAMLAGIDWTWESFPEYLATVDRLPKAINYGAYIGHSALRMYVMGKRALSEKATEDDLARMAAAVKEAIRSGAMGFSSSRATTHVTPDNTPVASRIADWSEVDRLVGAMAELNAGIFQVGPDTSGGEAQRRFLARLKQVAVETGRPVMFGTISSRQGDKPNPWTYQLEYLIARPPARGCGGRPPPDRSTPSSRSSPICRSTCCRCGERCATCRWTSRSNASPILRHAGSWSRPS